VDVGGQQIAAAITRDSAERLELTDGLQVTAIIKATDVMIGTD
jgi:molybdopterin-binding protein